MHIRIVQNTLKTAYPQKVLETEPWFCHFLLVKICLKKNRKKKSNQNSYSIFHFQYIRTAKIIVVKKQGLINTRTVTYKRTKCLFFCTSLCIHECIFVLLSGYISVLSQECPQKQSWFKNKSVM